MGFEVERVALERIDTSDLSYRITTPEDKPPLEATISRIGLACPVTLKDEKDRMVVVSGFRRIRACRSLQWPTIPCRVLSEDTPPTGCIEIAIAENLTQRPLNLIEQARCYQALFGGSIDNAAARGITDALGMPTNWNMISKLRAVLSTPESVQTGLVTGTISLPTALSLSEMANEDAATIASIFERLPMGLNKQREVLLYLNEIAGRDDVPLVHLLSEKGIQDVLEDPQLDGNQKSRQLRSYLRKRRYPRLHLLEEAFDQSIRDLGLGGAVQISPPPGFEGRTCSMTIRFASRQDLEQAHGKIAALLDHPLASRLFESL